MPGTSESNDERVRKRIILNADLLRPLLDSLSLAFEHERKVFTSSQPSAVRIQVTAPSRNGLDAISQVFNTAELLENIIIGLPVNKLLSRTQFVCKAFRNAVHGTPELRKKLFVQPDDRPGPTLMPPLKIRALDLDERTPAAPGFHILGVLRPKHVPALEIHVDLRKMYVSQPPATAFLLRQICYEGLYTNAVRPQPLEDVPVIKVPGGVQFKHVFAAIEVSREKASSSCQPSDMTYCWEAAAHNHEMQIEISDREQAMSAEAMRSCLPCGEVYEDDEGLTASDDLTEWKENLVKRYDGWCAMNSRQNFMPLRWR